jgi:hypothetical protein
MSVVAAVAWGLNPGRRKGFLFFIRVQTGSGAQKASYCTRTRVFPEVKQIGVTLAIYLHPVSSGAMTPLPLHAFIVCTGTISTLPLKSLEICISNISSNLKRMF